MFFMMNNGNHGSQSLATLVLFESRYLKLIPDLIFLRINDRFSCLKPRQHVSFLSPRPAGVCMCVSESEVGCIFVAFPRLSLILPAVE